MTDNFKSQRGTGANAGVQTNASVQTGSAPASCKVGIDIGSTTIKVVVLDAENRLVYKHYARHFSDIPTALVTNLTALRDVLVSLPGAATDIPGALPSRAAERPRYEHGPTTWRRTATSPAAT